MRATHVILAGGGLLLALYVTAEALWPASRYKDVGKGKRPAFPQITAANLEGKRYCLPRDFEGEANLCLIAFEQEQQKDVDTWLENLAPLQSVPGFVAYEFPTLFRGTPLFRGFLDGVMRRGIPDKAQRERTITLYLDRQAFRESLGLPTEQTIYAILVDRAGNILWRAEGPFTQEKGRALRQALRGRSTET